MKVLRFYERPQPDLNRRRRRERPVSWTGLDDGDIEKPGPHGPANRIMGLTGRQAPRRA